MITLRAPERYVNEFDALKDAGKYISEYGRKVYVIAGNTAWEKVKDDLEKSFEEWKIKYAFKIMDGYPGREKIKQYSQDAYKERAEVIVGAGGGKICDITKAVGDYLNLPVITIPTIAATCACWASRSILYKDDGDFDHVQWNRNSPKLVIADTKVLKEAPKRYLAAGIMDTYAKWYEFEPLISKNRYDAALRQNVAVSRAAFDVLREVGPLAMEKDVDDEVFKLVTDAILFLAGAAGSYSSGKVYRGAAHPFYFSSTRIKESRHLLHGEKVAFGLLFQFLLEGRAVKFIGDYLNDLKFYGHTEIPRDWNRAASDAVINGISELLWLEWKEVMSNFASSEQEIEHALNGACDLLEANR